MNENQRAAWALMPAAASGKEEILSSSGCTSGSYSQGWKSSSLESEGKISHHPPPPGGKNTEKRTTGCSGRFKKEVKHNDGVDGLQIW